MVAEVDEPLLQRVAAGVLAEDQLALREPDLLRPHDLVGLAVLEHAVLVDAGLVREGVLADDRLVPLHVQAGDLRDEPARRVEPLGLDAGARPEDVLARPERHHDLLERGVAGALADAVDRALDLPRALHHAARLFATARPRSLWQWTETTTLSMPRTCFLR